MHKYVTFSLMDLSTEEFIEKRQLEVQSCKKLIRIIRKKQHQ